MWQLDTEATKASSGSTCAGFDQGAGTTEGEGDAATVRPPSKVQVCSREYLPRRKSGLVRSQRMVALCSDIICRRGARLFFHRSVIELSLLLVVSHELNFINPALDDVDRMQVQPKAFRGQG